MFGACCVGGGLRDELIARSEESYRVCVCVCDLDTSAVKRLMPDVGYCATEKKNGMHILTVMCVNPISNLQTNCMMLRDLGVADVFLLLGYGPA